ncbi:MULTISPECIES: signal peptide protein [unclassified Streptomyces]|uniref:signal peptide protein n=1 Tax=unclassified Streptomyces TaxID=2593676 RepID=UPI003810F2D8
MSLTTCRLTAASLTLAAALVGAAGAAPALASTLPLTSTARTSSTAPSPTSFVDLPTQPLPAAGRSQTFTVSYRNDTAADQTVAPQVLVESPDAGPFLTPSDIRLEQAGQDGALTPVTVGSQTGTLFTDLTSAERTLHPGETLTQQYRITTTTPTATGTLHPRTALYN